MRRHPPTHNGKKYKIELLPSYRPTKSQLKASKRLFRCPGNCYGVKDVPCLQTRYLSSLIEHMQNIDHGHKSMLDIPRYNREMELECCPICDIPCRIKGGGFTQHMMQNHPGVGYTITSTNHAGPSPSSTSTSSLGESIEFVE